MESLIPPTAMSDLELAIKRYPSNKKELSYGTAGFRDHKDNLGHVYFRMGILAALRSKFKGAKVGLMITASHNPEEDNGLKLIDPHGEMLDISWEKLATQLANVVAEKFCEMLSTIIQSEKIPMEMPATLLIGYDTRESSTKFAQDAEDGAKLMNATVHNYGLVTTPQLHFLVFHSNVSIERPLEELYFHTLKESFSILYETESQPKSRYFPQLKVDGANGIGAIKLKLLQSYVPSLTLTVVNDGTSGKLNHECGADFIKVKQLIPKGNYFPGERCASFDGDADRIVYFYTDENSKLHLLDGDKIAALYVAYLKELMEKAGLQLDLCCVQTAYANGSSTAFIRDNLKVPVAWVKTGVKHLYNRAKQSEIAVIFEANGHGTVFISEDAAKKINEVIKISKNEEQKQAARYLLAIKTLVNQTVGDAISDLLFVEVILHAKDWSIKDWDAIYYDLPSRQLKVKVPDRDAIKTTELETECLSPPGLQDAIDGLVSQYDKARSFIRPSGTENVVRVYAEAATQDAADKLSAEVAALVTQAVGN